MDRQLQFFAYLLESYSQHKEASPAEILAQWDEHGITDFIYDMYEMYHQEAIENAFMDIESLLATGRPAW
ncbi:MAG: DUF3791 domain-containing protein [Coriobacteriales bacterium]|nr:DUF3791 domain-containing protein [Coriobacteriales bacterium]